MKHIGIDVNSHTCIIIRVINNSVELTIYLVRENNVYHTGVLNFADYYIDFHVLLAICASIL